MQGKYQAADARKLYSLEQQINTLRGLEQSVVRIGARGRRGQTHPLGTGFFVTPNLLATNVHIPAFFANPDKGSDLSQGHWTFGFSPRASRQEAQYPLRTVAGADFWNDIALLSVGETPGFTPQPLPIAAHTAVTAGKPRIPFVIPGFNQYAPGVIFSSIDLHNLSSFHTYSAQTISGTSGSPLLGPTGEVIGQHFGGTERSGIHTSYASPANKLQELLDITRTGLPPQGPIAALREYHWQDYAHNAPQKRGGFHSQLRSGRDAKEPFGRILHLASRIGGTLPQFENELAVAKQDGSSCKRHQCNGTQNLGCAGPPKQHCQAKHHAPRNTGIDTHRDWILR